MARMGHQSLQPARQFRIIWEAIKRLTSEGRGEITVEELRRALERMMMHQYELQTPMTVSDLDQIYNTCTLALHIHLEAKANADNAE